MPNISYEFYAVHNICTREDDVFHEVYVPDMHPVVSGAGDTLEAAVAAASEMLTIAIEDMQSRGEPIPLPKSYDWMKNEGVAAETKINEWFWDKTNFIGVVSVKSHTTPIIEKTKEELEELERETRLIWDEVCKERLLRTLQ
jgi:predicted RNase H-like HicB family nuclease